MFQNILKSYIIAFFICSNCLFCDKLDYGEFEGFEGESCSFIEYCIDIEALEKARNILMRVADFFCGGGGFSEGFRQAGFEIVFAVDKWEPAVNTYKGNKPGVNVHLDDVIKISQLPEEEFEELVPDSEVIIGSPPCQSFSNSNKSGNSDKSLGIRLIEAYLRIIARKKYKLISENRHSCRLSYKASVEF